MQCQIREFRQLFRIRDYHVSKEDEEENMGGGYYSDTYAYGTAALSMIMCCGKTKGGEQRFFKL